MLSPKQDVSRVGRTMPFHACSVQFPRPPARSKYERQVALPPVQPHQTSQAPEWLHRFALRRCLPSGATKTRFYAQARTQIEMEDCCGTPSRLT